MADNYALFYESDGGDRVYSADSFSDWLYKFFTSGVFQNELMVSASSGMDVVVGHGYCNIKGKVRIFTSNKTITLDPANSSLPRIDTIVLERNDTERDITIKYVKGVLSGNNPVPTPPERGGAVYQLVLAQIYVDAGATAITQGKITDTRPDSNLCGWVMSTVNELDITQITEQNRVQLNELLEAFDTQFSGWYNRETSDFQAWFDEMKDQLSTDAAGHLQLEIDDINDKIDRTAVATSLSATGWSNGVYSFEATYPSASYDIEIEPNGDSITTAQLDAWGNARLVGSATTNAVKACGTVPTVDIPVIVRTVKK